ncbi:hypothetical protein C8R45DRAFT_157009 [Mycena sanguinolenta]|nr:hypothetical protein C8R45DRAFT_157009 [Mycena sanguinolenta]
MGTRTLAVAIAALCQIGLVNGVGPKVSPTGAENPNSQILVPTFSFNNVSEMTTCAPAAISWVYSPNANPDPLQLALYITNAQVPQPPPPTSPTVSATFSNPSASWPLNNTTRMIVSSTDPLLYALTWSAVSVVAGWYRLTGIIHLPNYDFIQQSNDFYVQNGTDFSCTILVPASSSGDLTASSIPTSTGNPTSPETISAVHPARHNDGAIAGGVVGGVVVAVAIIAAYLYCRRKSPRIRATREWAVLGALESESKTSPTATTTCRSHTKSDSVQPMVSSNEPSDTSIRPRIEETWRASSYTNATDISTRPDSAFAYGDAEGPFSNSTQRANGSSSSLTMRPAYPSGASQEILGAFMRLSPTNESGSPERTATLGQHYNLVDPVLVSSLPRRSVHEEEEDVFSDRFRV